MIKINSPKSIIANSITTLNILCGFVSIVFASQGDYKMAVIFVILAAIFDTLDGLIARLLNTSSRFGVELDSLSDVVSFGAAPAFLVYQSYAYQYGIWGILLSSSLLIFGALRLARFNIMLEDISIKADFRGLPIPMAAITVSSFIYSYHHESGIIEPFNNFVIPLIALLSLLMVSDVRYNALPKLHGRKKKILIFFVLVITLSLAFITNGEIIFYLLFSIILFGIVRYIYFLFVAK